jgi:surface carbohydrate biosynthesis protein
MIWSKELLRLGYELLSRLHRVAFFSIRGNVLNTHGFNFGWPSRLEDVGKFWTNIPDVFTFKKIMDYVINCSNKEWDLEANAVSSQIMKYDYNNSIILITKLF